MDCQERNKMNEIQMFKLQKKTAVFTAVFNFTPLDVRNETGTFIIGMGVERHRHRHRHRRIGWQGRLHRRSDHFVI